MGNFKFLRLIAIHSFKNVLMTLISMYDKQKCNVNHLALTIYIFDKFMIHKTEIYLFLSLNKELM